MLVLNSMYFICCFLPENGFFISSPSWLVSKSAGLQIFLRPRIPEIACFNDAPTFWPKSLYCLYVAIHENKNRQTSINTVCPGLELFYSAALVLYAAVPVVMYTFNWIRL
jgi:hypothetical protein